MVISYMITKCVYVHHAMWIPTVTSFRHYDIVVQKFARICIIIMHHPFA